MGYKWKDEYYVKVYRLARSGLSGKEIAKALGIQFTSFILWKKKYPALKKAFEDGRKGRPSNTNDGTSIDKFHELYYQRLPPKLKELWEKINEVESEYNGVLKIEALLKNEGQSTLQHLFLYAMTAYNFNENKACRQLGITRGMIRKWQETDPQFPVLLEDLLWFKKNYYENALLELVARGDGPAILMVNRTYNRDRGYNEKMDVNVNGRMEHEHKHVHVVVDDLNLPIETRKQILEAVRENKVIESNGHQVTSVQ